MPSAQVRFRQQFTALMAVAANQIGAVVLRAAEDGVVPVESAGRVSGDALVILDRVFLQNGSRVTVATDGTPQSPYARLLLEEIGRTTYEIVTAHRDWLRKRLPGDVRLWMQGGARVREMTIPPLTPPATHGENHAGDPPDRPYGMLVREITADELRERLPDLTEEEIQAAIDLRLFDPNRLAEYERAHTWVDPRGYRLSDRIWRIDQATRDKLDALLIDAIAEGKGAEEIARLVEQFLIPGREKVRTNKPYGSDASYDAMRLARTEIARAANQAAYISAYMNPYVDRIDVVRSANGDPTCPICPTHATVGINGERLQPPYSIYAANIAPYHPHCMCRVQGVATDDVRVVEDRLRRMIQASRERNLTPYVNPTQAEAFTQQLLGEALWAITRQVLPVQPGLF